MGLEDLGGPVCVFRRTAYIGAIRSLVTSGTQLPALQPTGHPAPHHSSCDSADCTLLKIAAGGGKTKSCAHKLDQSPIPHVLLGGSCMAMGLGQASPHRQMCKTQHGAATCEPGGGLGHSLDSTGTARPQASPIYCDCDRQNG